MRGGLDLPRSNIPVCNLDFETHGDRNFDPGVARILITYELTTTTTSHLETQLFSPENKNPLLT